MEYFPSTPTMTTIPQSRDLCRIARDRLDTTCTYIDKIIVKFIVTYGFNQTVANAVVNIFGFF